MASNNTSFVTNIVDESESNLGTSFSTPLKIIVLTFIMVFALLGNILLITSVLKSSRMRKSITSLLILNLAVCDIMIVSISIPGEIVAMAYTDFVLGAVGCRLLHPISTYALIAAVFTLMTISIERYVATAFPFRYRLFKSKGKYILVLLHCASIACVVPYSMTLTLTTSEEHGTMCNETWSASSGVVYTVVLFLFQYALPLPIIISLYTRTWFLIKKQNDDIIRDAEFRRCRTGPVNAQDIMKVRLEVLKKICDDHKNKRTESFFQKVSSRFPLWMKRETDGEKFSTPIAVLRHKQTMRMLKLFICIVLVFAICMLPNQIMWLHMTLSNTTIGDIPITIAYWLTYTNSVFNPLIYGIHPKFRKVYYQNFKKLARFLCKTIMKQSRFPPSAVTDDVGRLRATSDSFGWTPDLPRRRNGNRDYSRKLLQTGVPVDLESSSSSNSSNEQFHMNNNYRQYRMNNNSLNGKYHTNNNTSNGKYHMTNRTSNGIYHMNNDSLNKQCHINNDSSNEQYDIDNCSSNEQYDMSNSNSNEQCDMNNGNSNEQCDMNNGNSNEQYDMNMQTSHDSSVNSLYHTESSEPSDKTALVGVTPVETNVDFFTQIDVNYLKRLKNLNETHC